MRKAAELISPCRYRSPPVSTLLSEASRATVVADAVVHAVASTSGRVSWPSAHQTRHSRALHLHISSQHCCSSLQSTTQSDANGIVYVGVSSTRTAFRPTSMVVMTLSAAGVAPLPFARVPPYHVPVRSFAASAADPLRNGGTGGGHEPMAETVAAEEAARMVLEDPMSRLMASRGMPVGMSLRRQEAGETATAGSSSSSNGGNAALRSAGGGSWGGVDEEGGQEDVDLSRPPPAEPAYTMEALTHVLNATVAAASRNRGGVAAAATTADNGGGGGFMAGVQHVTPSLDDSWGTTRESPADIARRIVESNLGAERGTSHDADDVDDADDDAPDHVSEGVLSPSEEKYANLEVMSADIKKLDEVFEVLASVPWLDEDVLAEKELKGVAQVGLLGTLEEVGFNVRHQLLRIWAGERGAELAAGPGLEFRDQAALLAILYHTQRIEEKHGPPPKGFLPKPTMTT